MTQIFTHNVSFNPFQSFNPFCFIYKSFLSNIIQQCTQIHNPKLLSATSC